MREATPELGEPTLMQKSRGKFEALRVHEVHSTLSGGTW
jgi:hypothetical protein